MCDEVESRIPNNVVVCCSMCIQWKEAPTIAARDERAFRLVKNPLDFAKVRYRGLYKNMVRALTMFALSNLYLARRLLMAK